MYWLFVTVLYFYIGYTYLCWHRYKDGAGFEVDDSMAFFFEPSSPGLVLGVLFWPFVMPIHCIIVIYKEFNFHNIVSKISPLVFLQKR